MTDERKKLQHLLLRAGFGATPDLLKRFDGMTISAVVDELFSDAATVEDLLFLERPRTNSKGEISPVQLVFMFLKAQHEKEQLNLAWLDRMAVAKAQLREKMTLFWHNHFATSTFSGWLMQAQHNTLRKHALGNFRDMLHAMGKDPAMILWLNNQQNKKDAPNENFAREVMELFTLGEGNGYTEDDIKQAARAFTGWTVNLSGEFEFNAKVHDDGEKTVFGKKGNFDGDDIIDLLLEKSQCAEFICRKIYKWFVNAEIDDDNVQDLADRFRKTGYDISDLMKTIFNARWFYDSDTIGCMIASPVELIVRFKKLCKMEVDDRQMLALQEVLSQTLFLPPNVAGWKGGRSWIDSTSLVQRMHIAKSIVEAGTARLHKRPAFEEKNDGQNKENEQVKVKSDWTSLVDYFSSVAPDKLMDEAIRLLIQSPADRIDKTAISKAVDVSSDQKRIITTLSAIMQTPEFQLI